MLFLLLLLASAHAEEACTGPQAVMVSGLTDNCDFIQDLDRATFTFGESFGCQQVLMGEGKLTQLNYPRNFCSDEYKPHPMGTPPPMHPSVRWGSRSVDGGGNKKDLEAAIGRAAVRLGANQPFLLYFTDHGGTNGNDDRNSSNVVMQDKNSLSPGELRTMLDKVPAGAPVTLINDHCHSAGMLHALFGSDGRPRDNACGAAAAHANEYSYSGQSMMDFATRLKNDPVQFRLADTDRDGSISLDELVEYFRARPDNSQNEGEGVFSAGVTSSSFFLEQYAKRKGVIRASEETPISEIIRCPMGDESYLGRLFHDGIFVLQKILAQARAGEMNREIDKLAKTCPDALGADGKLTMRQLEIAQEQREREIHALLKRKLFHRDAVYDYAKERIEKKHPGWVTDYDNLMVQARLLEIYAKDPRGFCATVDPGHACCQQQEGLRRRITLKMPGGLRRENDWFSCSNIGAVALHRLVGRLTPVWKANFAAAEKELQDNQTAQEIHRAHSRKNKDARQCRMLLTKLRERESLRYMLQNDDVDAFQDYFKLQTCERRPLFQLNGTEEPASPFGMGVR